MPKEKYHTRPCRHCGVEVIDVRDAFTGATYPVNATPRPLTDPGLVLSPREDPRMNPLAELAVVYVPHFPVCPGPEKEYVDEEKTKAYAHTQAALAEALEDLNEEEPAGVGSDPIVDDPEIELDDEKVMEDVH